MDFCAVDPRVKQVTKRHFEICFPSETSGRIEDERKLAMVLTVRLGMDPLEAHLTLGRASALKV
jgi:hypothetical protein